MKNGLKASQLKQLYYFRTHGDSLIDAAHKAGVEYATAVFAMKRIKSYMAWVLDGEKTHAPKDMKRLTTSYVIAARQIVSDDHMVRYAPEKVECAPVPEQKLMVEPTTKVDDHYAKLTLQFGVFTDAIYAFIREEVEKQVGDIKAENEKMKQLIDGARVGNFADALKKYWEGK